MQPATIAFGATGLINSDSTLVLGPTPRAARWRSLASWVAALQNARRRGYVCSLHMCSCGGCFLLSCGKPRAPPQNELVYNPLEAHDETIGVVMIILLRRRPQSSATPTRFRVLLALLGTLCLVACQNNAALELTASSTSAVSLDAALAPLNTGSVTMYKAPDGGVVYVWDSGAPLDSGPRVVDTNTDVPNLRPPDAQAPVVLDAPATPSTACGAAIQTSDLATCPAKYPSHYECPLAANPIGCVRAPVNSRLNKKNMCCP